MIDFGRVNDASLHGNPEGPDLMAARSGSRRASDGTLALASARIFVATGAVGQIGPVVEALEGRLLLARAPTDPCPPARARRQLGLSNRS